MKVSKVAQWFEEHPGAEEEARASRAAGRTWLDILLSIRSGHGFPFVNPQTLARYMKGEIGQAEAPVKKTRAARPATPPVPTFERTPADMKKLAKADVFFVTSAVSNTHADADFLAAVRQWQNYTGGKVLVNPVLYVNPTRRLHEQEDDARVWWDTRLADWMLSQELRPHPKLSVMTTKAQATANNPLPPRAEALTKNRSAVFGHPQLMMKTIATPQDDRAKILYSSGAITRADYSDTITGEIAKFHHVLGGVIVEVQDGRFHLREVNWDGHEFIDLDTSFQADGVYHAESSLALVMGDIHVGLHCPRVMEGTFGAGGLLETTDAERILLHDLFDGGSVNHHEAANMISRARAYQAGRTSLFQEIARTREWLDQIPMGPELFVVASNHDDFLHRWLQRGERGVESENLYLYHRLAASMIREKDQRSAIQIALEDVVGYDGRAHFMNVDETLRLKGVELGMHGHLGPNGARGSIRNLSRIGTRSIIGHSHSPGIFQGVYQVGHSSQNRHGYNVGPSSWSTTHALLHANGRRQLVHMIGDKFRRS